MNRILERRIGNAVKSLVSIGDKHERLGSGFIAEVEGRKLLLSARHCFQKDGQAIKTRTITLYSGEEIQIDPKNRIESSEQFEGVDVVIFGFDSNVVTPGLKLAQTVEANETAVLMGYPKRYLTLDLRGVHQPVVSIGRVLELASGHPFDIINNAVLEGGSSGGPLLNEKGEVIGVHYASEVKGSVDDIDDYIMGRKVADFSYSVSLPYLRDQGFFN